MMKRQPFWIVALALAAIVLGACGGPNTQQLGTPIPTLVPATPARFAALEAPVTADGQEPCAVKAPDLLGAWVNAGYPETEPFPFSDVEGNDCAGTYAEDIQPLFSQSNVWYSSAPACVTCHHADVQQAWAQLDLSSYQGVAAGSRRASPEATGTNILGEGDWEKAILKAQLTTGRMPTGRPVGMDLSGPVVQAGVRR